MVKGSMIKKSKGVSLPEILTSVMIALFLLTGVWRFLYVLGVTLTTGNRYFMASLAAHYRAESNLPTELCNGLKLKEESTLEENIKTVHVMALDPCLPNENKPIYEITLWRE